MTSECLEENEIVDFVTQNLTPDQAARAEAHIDTCAGCRAVLIELARVFELKASALPMEDSREDTEESGPAGLGLLPPELLRGTTVGRYVMLDILGTGAMGVVFAAYDPELDRKVALKLLRDRTRDPERNARMMREARSTARLSHPNVVVVHDVGVHEGTVFMAMELVPGGTLGDWLKKTPRDRNAILHAFIEAGAGLAAAHEAGLVHRDFKPANVLMGADGRARVTDFGLARAGGSYDALTDDTSVVASTAPARDVLVTKTGALVGTPAYMSPEQFEGRLADAKSDQFSYCVALAEALTGERPFEGRTLMELQASVCAGQLRPGALDAVTRRLTAALQRGLSVEASARFEDMRSLVGELTRVRRTSKRKTLARASVVGLAIIGGAGIAWAGSSTSRREVPLEMCRDDAAVLAWSPRRAVALQTSLAALDRPAAGRIARSATGLMDAYAESWASARADACASRDPLGSRFATLQCLSTAQQRAEALLVALADGTPAVLEHAEEAIRKLPAPRACTEPRWRDVRVADEPPEAIREIVETQQAELALAKAYLETGQYTEAEARSAAIVDAAAPLGFSPLIVDGQTTYAAALNGSGKSEPAEAALRTAWSEAIRAGDPVWQVRVGAALFDLLGNQEADRDLGAFWGDVSAAALDRLDEDDRAAWDYWNARGTFEAYGGNYDVALQALDAALAVPDIDISQTLASTMGRLAVRGQHAKAAELEVLLTEAQALVDLVRATLGPDHPRMIRAAQPLSTTLARLGRGTEALEALDDAMRIAQEVLAPNDPRIAGLLTVHAQALDISGDGLGARKDYQRIVEIREASNPDDDLAIALAYNNLAANETGLGEFEASIEHMEHALPRLKAAFGDDHLNVGNAHTTLSSNLIKLGRHAEARVHLEEAERIAEAFGAASARLDPIIALNFSRVELAAGHLAVATRRAAEAVRMAKEAYGESHPVLGKALAVQAEIALSTDDVALAGAAIDEGWVIAESDADLRGTLSWLKARRLASLGDVQGCARAKDAAAAAGHEGSGDPCR